MDEGTHDAERTFIGERYDTESSLSYLNARMYDGGRGQFQSQDPVFWEVGLTQDGRAVLMNPQAQNSYSYAQNNPLVYKDPTGRIAVGVGFEGTGGTPGLYGSGGMYGVIAFNTQTFNVEVGIVSSVDGGGSTALGGVSGGVGALFSNANTIQELEGPEAILGGSVRAGPAFGVDVGLSGSGNPKRKIVTVNPSIGFGGVATPYGLPAELHGGGGYTRSLTQANLTKAIKNSAAAAKASIQKQLDSIAKQIKKIQKAINQLKAKNSKKD